MVLSIAFPVSSASAVVPDGVDHACAVHLQNQTGNYHAFVCITVDATSSSTAGTFPGAARFDCDNSAPCDVDHVSYPVKFGNGETGQESPRGRSVGAVVSEMFPGRQFAFATVDLPNRRHLAVLTKSELSDDGSGTLPPVLYQQTSGTGNDVGFLRPQRNEEDLNGPDSGEDQDFVHVDLHTNGEALFPSVDKKIEGSRVTLTAKVSSSNPLPKFRYTWFAPRARDSDDLSSYSYDYVDSACNQYVAVAVTDTSDTSYGESSTLKVGDGKKDCPSSEGTTTSPTPTKPVPSRAPTVATPGAGPSESGPGADTGAGAGTAAAPGPGRGTPGTGHATAAVPILGNPTNDTGVLVSGRLLTSDGGGGSGGQVPASSRPPRLSASPPPAAGGDLVWLWLLLPFGLLAAGVATERRRG